MPKHDIFSFCLRRSGHTAIMHWIAAQQQPAHILKDCNMENNVLSTPTIRYVEDDTVKSMTYRGAKNTLIYLDRKERAEALSEYQLVISAFEDGNVVPFSTEEIRDVVERYKLVDDAKIVIVLRDPFNLFASRIWRNRNGYEVPHNYRAVNWFNRQLDQYENEGDFIFIDYYSWVTSKACRIFTAKMLGIPYSDKFHKEQANVSSFDGFDQAKVQAGFAERWKQFLTKADSAQKIEFLTCLENIDMDACCRYFMHLDSRETLKEVKRLV